MRGNHLFELFRAEKVILPGCLDHLFELFRAAPHLGSFLDPWSKVRGNHFFELFRAEIAEKVEPWRGITFLSFSAENAEKVIPPHVGSFLDPWSKVRGNHLFELFGAENAEKVIPPHLGSSLDPCNPFESPF